jgi:PhzF family phenazine biosynthesis protein
MPSRPFQQVDVFTEAPTRGNPVAVVLDGAGLRDDEMQAVARWTNLSETTFVLPPTVEGADYRLRIFTPCAELDFAGHPTLGTCHAWLRAGGVPRSSDQIVQQANVGLVRLRRDPHGLAFAAPPCTRTPVDAAELAATLAALGLPESSVEEARLLDNGTVWLAVLVADAATVLGLRPDHAALRSRPKVGVIGRHPAGTAAAVEVRAFAASVGIAEDPVTGSLQASVAQWLTDTGVLPPRYEATQGTCIGRDGRVHLVREGDEVWVGGGTHTVVDGTIDL